MASKSGRYRTTGYISPDGVEHLFAKGLKPTAGKRMVAHYKRSWEGALERLLSGKWDEIDDFAFADVKLYVEARKREGMIAQYDVETGRWVLVHGTGPNRTKIHFRT
jgi:hypothetical protein